jgi:prepilin-type N-terminal cleavage/methylation domain-containing protein
MREARGFTLIELIMIMVVLGIMGAFLASTMAQLPRGLEVDTVAQTASQLAQQCSERVLARRRSSAPGQGYASIVIASDPCAGLPNLGYTVTGTVDLSGSDPPCPPLASCKQVTVTVTRNLVTVAKTVFVLVDY